MPTNALRSPRPRPALPDPLIVARDHAGLCQALREIAAQGKFTVVVDRRGVERRKCVQYVRVERRRGERRSAAATTATRRRRAYTLVRQGFR